VPADRNPTFSLGNRSFVLSVRKTQPPGWVFSFPRSEKFHLQVFSAFPFPQSPASKDHPMSLKHFLNTQDWSRPELDALLTQAALFKRNKLGDQLKGKSIALVFFNPSMRTRTSFELGAFQLGAHAVVLQPGKDAWPIEFNLGTVMDGDTEEHIAEVAKVLGRYCDIIAVPSRSSWTGPTTARTSCSTASQSIRRSR